MKIKQQKVSQILAAASVTPYVGTSTTAVVSESASGTIATYPPLPLGEEIYDITSVYSLSWPWIQMILQTVSVMLILWLLWVVYSWLTAPAKRKRKIISQSPQKMAFRAIERLKLSPIWNQRQMKEICETVAAILKNYLYEAFSLGIGCASTTDELLTALQRNRIRGKLFSKSRELLESCDQVKFMGTDANSKNHEDMLEMLFELVKVEEWRK